MSVCVQEFLRKINKITGENYKFFKSEGQVYQFITKDPFFGQLILRLHKNKMEKIIKDI